MLRNFIATALLLGSATMLATPALAASPPSSGNYSSNWSGYIADTAIYTGVGATWNVPTPGDTNSVAGDGTWVGIGGSGSRDLIQAGTQAIQQDGTTQFQAWYELLPTDQVAIPVSVHGGDSVSVSILYLGSNLWSISFANNTTGEHYATSVVYRSNLSSAEWIEEMPTLVSNAGAKTYLPLDNFGTVQFSDAWTITQNGRQTLSEANAQPLTMADGRLALAVPATLAEDAFSVSRETGSEAITPTYVYSQPSATGHHLRRGSGYGRTIVITFSI